MNQKAMMVNQIQEIGRQHYNYIDLTKGLSVMEEVLKDQEVSVFYTTDRIISPDYQYMEGIQTLLITDKNKLYQFNFEAASFWYDVVNPWQVLRIEVTEFLPDALLTRKDKLIQMQVNSSIHIGGLGANIWLDATPDEGDQLKGFISSLSDYIGKTI